MANAQVSIPFDITNLPLQFQLPDGETFTGSIGQLLDKLGEQIEMLCAENAQLDEGLVKHVEAGAAASVLIAEQEHKLQQMRAALKRIREQGHTMAGTPLGTNRQERNIWQQMTRVAEAALDPAGEINS